MKNLKIVLFVFVLLFIKNYVFGQEVENNNIIDLAKCNFYIKDVKVVDQLADMNGNVLKPGDGFKLIVIEIIGKSYSKGLIVYNPSIFTFIYNDNQNDCRSSQGVGQKFTLADGSPIDLWILSLKGSNTSTSMKVDENKEIQLYVACALPVNVKEFYIMVPSLMTESGKIQ